MTVSPTAIAGGVRREQHHQRRGVAPRPAGRRRRRGRCALTRKQQHGALNSGRVSCSDLRTRFSDCVSFLGLALGSEASAWLSEYLNHVEFNTAKAKKPPATFRLLRYILPPPCRAHTRALAHT